MAAGVQQASNGAVLTFEDHSNGEAGADAAYSLAEIEAQVVAKGFKAADGTTPTIVKQTGAVTQYLCHNDLRNGDGTGSAPTRLLINADEKLTFVAGKGYDTRAEGLLTRTLEMGTKVVPATGEPFGYGGGSVEFGKSTLLQGVLKLYGARLRTIGSNAALQITPNLAATGSEIYNVHAECQGQLLLGDADGEVLIVNSEFVQRGSTTNVLSQANLAAGSRGVRILAAGQQRLTNTGAFLKGRGFVFGGNVTTALLRNSSAGNRFQDPVYEARNVPLSDLLVIHEELFTYEAIVMGGSPVVVKPGISVEVFDQYGALVVDTVSDANGAISFGPADEPNGLLVRSVNGSVGSGWTVNRREPFTVKANHKGAVDPAFAAYQATFRFPSLVWIADGISEQIYPVRMPIVLQPIPGGGPYYRHEDVDLMLEEFGEDVTIGGVTAKGIVERVGEPVVGGYAAVALGVEISVLVKDGTYPALAVGVVVSVDGGNYYARDVRQEGDGALVRVLLSVEAA